MNRQELTEIKKVSLDSIPKIALIAIYMIGLGSIIVVMSGGGYLIGKRDTGWIAAIIAIAFMISAIPIHELAHGLIFYIYTKKVKFGMKWHKYFLFIAYATSPLSILTKRQMILVNLAPQIITVIIFALLPFIGHINGWLPYSLLSFSAMNLGGGCADIYSVFVMVNQKGKIYVEDTMTGMILYRRNEA